MLEGRGWLEVSDQEEEIRWDPGCSSVEGRIRTLGLTDQRC